MERMLPSEEAARRLGVKVSTLYAYVDPKGEPRPRAVELLGKRSIKPAPATRQV